MPLCLFVSFLTNPNENLKDSLNCVSVLSVFFVLCVPIMLQIGDVWNQFLASLAAAETEAAAGDLWRAAVEQGSSAT